MDKVTQLRSKLNELQLEAMLIMQPDNRRYLSGFTGSAGFLLITPTDAYLLTDSRYLEQALEQAPEFKIVKQGPSQWDEAAQLSAQFVKLGFESDYVTCAQYDLLKDQFSSIELVALQGIVEGLRLIKQDDELTRLQKAAGLADQAFDHIKSFIRPGISEREVALELEFFMRSRGATAAAFDIIAASGPRSALPHGMPTERKLSEGDFLTLDFGAVVEGYCSDITRTLVIGTPSPKQQSVYEVVRKAQASALTGVKPGMLGAEVDKLARDIINDAGYGEYFGHGLGHGLGLAVHEEPRLSPLGTTVLEPGMVVTVEPGIYIPGWGGVRIEDPVVITASGCKVLTNSDKRLIII